MARRSVEDSPIRVLLVEDNADDATLLERALAGGDHIRFRVDCAWTLREALDRLGGERYDAALLDLSLLDSAGLETLDGVHSRFPSLPVVVLTGLDNEDTAIEALHHGA